MRRNFLLLMAAFGIAPAFSQNIFKAQIKDATTNEPLIGSTAIVKGKSIGSSADINGMVRLKNVPNGKQVIVFSHVGYNLMSDTLLFPLADSAVKIIKLKPELENLDEVVVTSTRSSRTFTDIPTRVETVSGEELEEKAVSQPNNAKMILTESTGIQTQQTSATSANASIRIQGLNGKYTQLLRDGFPLYNGFSGGLSILQITPLDLKRVELIKGSSSTLYGGGAVAGLINFITKVPTAKRELSFLVNANQSNAQDISGYYTQKFKKIGITFFASQNLQAAYDPNKDGLSDIPKFTRYNINPRIFYYIDKSATLSLGINSSFENRLGGDMKLINGKADSTHSYFEKNVTSRNSSQLKFEKTISNRCILIFKNSVGYFDRSIAQPGYLFSGRQVSSFSELSYLVSRQKMEWVLGGNMWTDNFKQTSNTLYPLDNNLMIGGAFVQNNFKASEKLIVETGLRTDVTNQNSLFALPRISAMYKFTRNLTARIGGGLGYKTPTVFSEEAEERAFKNIQPLDLGIVKPERSIGGNFDVNYSVELDEELSLSLNQLFFYTRVNKPLVLSDSPLPNGNYQFYNANGYLDSQGFETNLKLSMDDIALYWGYTFINATRYFDNTSSLNPLTAKHRIYATLLYEIEGKLRLGYELFYTGQQQLSDGSSRPDYWIMGVSAEYKFKHFSLFANAENFTDIRQTRFESMYTGTLQNPQFKEIWAPTDGFIYNGGFRINIW
jgi:outer membrane receptor for ferrienterochelin and colicins